MSTKWATDPYRPWCGIDPLTFAHLSGQLHAKLTEALRDEAGGPRGHIIPAPIGPGQNVDQVRDVVRNLKGSTGVIEWADTAFDDGGTGRARGRVEADADRERPAGVDGRTPRDSPSASRWPVPGSRRNLRRPRRTPPRGASPGGNSSTRR